MAIKTINISSWEANIRLNTDNEANIAHADYKQEVELIFGSAKPESVEIQCQHTGLNVLTGNLRFYQKMSADLDYVEITNADALPEPIPVPLDAAAGNYIIYFWNFTGYALKIKFDTTATAGVLKLAAGLRNE